jgi:hypothetical protein
MTPVPQAAQQPLDVCPQCGCTELFLRKDFPQKVGLLIVITAGITFLVLASNPHRFYIGAWILVASVVIDVLLYLIVPTITVCYRCRAEYRNVPANPKHGGFELSTGEKYRSAP